MKKIVIIILFLLVLTVIIMYSFCSKVSNNTMRSDDANVEYEVDSKLVLKSINMCEEKDEYAKKILYKYLLEQFYMLIEKDEEMNAILNEHNLDLLRATLIDLNDDGENEIIGYVEHGMFGGTAGQELFILSKDKNGKYQEISEYLNFETQRNIYILKDKDNGYHRIIIYGSVAYDFKPFLVTYNNGVYGNSEQSLVFSDFMKDFNNYRK